MLLSDYPEHQPLPVRKGHVVTIPRGTPVRHGKRVKPAGRTYKVKVHHIICGVRFEGEDTNPVVTWLGANGESCQTDMYFLPEATCGAKNASPRSASSTVKAPTSWWVPQPLINASTPWSVTYYDFQAQQVFREDHETLPSLRDGVRRTLKRIRYSIDYYVAAGPDFRKMVQLHHTE